MQNRNKLRYKRQTYSYLNGKGKRRGTNQGYGIKRYKLLYIKIDKPRDI